MKIPRDTPLKKASPCCDEAVGFIGACVKVRPTEDRRLPAESVLKKLKDRPSPAAGSEYGTAAPKAVGRRWRSTSRS